MQHQTLNPLQGCSKPISSSCSGISRPPNMIATLHSSAPTHTLIAFSSTVTFQQSFNCYSPICSSLAIHPYACLYPKTSTCLQKLPSYSGQLSSETPGDSKHTFLHHGDVVLQIPAVKTWYLVMPAGFGLSTVSWLVFIVTFLSDLSRYSLEQTWLWRFPLVLIAAGQLAQFR